MKADSNIQEPTPSVAVPPPAAPENHVIPGIHDPTKNSAEAAEAAEESKSWIEPLEAQENLVDWSTLSETERLKAKKELEDAIVRQLSTVFDPEIPVNIYELGLIYEIRIDDERKVIVQMTLTSPACPVAGSLPLEVEEKTLHVEGVASARTELVWEPPWTPDMMSEAAKLELGFF